MMALSKLLVGVGLASAVRHRQESKMLSAGVSVRHYWYRHLQKEDSQVAAASTGEGEYDWVLKLKDDFDEEQVKALCGSDCKFTGRQGGVPLASLRASESKLDTVLLRGLARYVEFAEPDSPVQLQELMQSEESVLAQSSADPYWHLREIGLPEAQGTGKGVTVYVMDTGVRTTHQQFTGRAIPGLEADSNGRLINCNEGVNKGDPNCASDHDGHGTHVAGTVAGFSVGVAKEAKIVALKVCCGPSTNFYGAMDWVAFEAPNAKPAVVTVGFGGDTTPDSARVAVDAVTYAGVLVIVTAGSDDDYSCTKSFSFITNAFAVGAADSTLARASFSNWGNCVGLYAPGVDIISTDYKSDIMPRMKSGTSMATAAVAGAAALELEAYPNAQPGQLKVELLNKAKRNVMSNLKAYDPNLFLWVGQ